MDRNRMLLMLVVCALFLPALLASGVQAATVSNWLTTSEMANAMSLPDGSHVALHLEEIVKIKTDPAYIVIAEPFHHKDRLICLTYPSPDLRLGQVVDVEGNLTTLANGARALQNVTVWGYASESGELTYHPSIIKSFSDETPWRWGKIDLTDKSATPNLSAESISSNEPNSDPADGPTYYAKIGSATESSSSQSQAQSQSVRTQSFYNGIPDLAGLPAGSLVELQCKRTVGVGTEIIDGTTYKYLDMAEDLPSTDWIRCYYNDGTPTTDDRINKITGQIRYTNNGTTEVICVDAGSDYDPRVLEGKLSIVSENTIAYVLSQADGATADLTGKVVTANNDLDFPGTLYIQEPIGSGNFGGIRVEYSNYTFSRGDIVSVTGTVALDSDGERKIVASSVTSTRSDSIPGALGMPNKMLGGGQFNVNTPGVDYPTGSGTGLYNKGLLVKSWGRVIAVDATNKYFYIDDGTGFQDGSGNTGVKVGWDWTTAGKPDIVVPEDGWYVSVVGISSSESDGCGNLIRVLRPRKYDDILAVNPQDDADPTVTITSPVGNEWHKASNATSVYITGTAVDSDTGIKSVEIKTGSGDWVDISSSYIPSTGAWSYTWVTPAAIFPTTIQVRATDYAGNSDTRSVTISNVDVIYVSKNGSNSNAGTSWDTAKLTISGTNGAMSAASSGMEIWVAEGRYVECVTLTSGVALYGGFSGDETVREQRNWTNHETIIDANMAGRVVTISGTANTLTRVDGFTIQKGSSSSSGAGIYCSSASATISNNNVLLNTASSGGGGIYCTVAVTISNNNIYSNTSYQSGGGVSCDAGVTISNNNIYSNSSSYTGGGIACGTSTISGNSIYANTGGTNGGGISCGAATISNNKIYSNKTNTYSGGGIYCNGNANISNNTITANTAKTAGGGISCFATATISNNICNNNTALTDGGGVYVSGSGSSHVLVSNIFAANNASNGGGIYYNSSSGGQIINNTVIHNANTSNPDINYGGGIFLNSTVTATVANNIVAFNTGGGINGPSTLAYTKNILYQNTVSNYNWDTSTNYHPVNDLAPDNPGIPYAEYGDWHIAGNSPCKDTGASVSGLPSNDIDGDPRQNGIVDIGADEYNGNEPRNLVENPKVIYVQPSGNDGNGGTSWTDAVATVQKGIDLANLSCGAEVWVAAGTYGAVSLKPFAKVYGGFALGAADKSNRVYATILDGNSSTSVVKIVSAPASKIDGFTIQHGSATSGAGVYCTSPATISNNNICSNSGRGVSCSGYGIVVSGNNVYSNTGGIDCSGYATISNNNIYSNSSVRGGGIGCSGYVTISDNNIYSNTALGSTSYGSNISGDGGGIYCSGAATISNNKICSNTTNNYGGGGGIYSSASATISNNLIHANTSGGGVYVGSSSPILVGNVITANIGGGVSYSYTASSGGQIANNTIIHNLSNGISLLGSGATPTLTNNIVAFNTGHGISASTERTCTNNIFYNNTVDNYSWNALPTYHPNNDLSPNDPGIPYAEYGDWHIAGDSPCKDAGDTDSVSSILPDKDIDGESRIYDDPNVVEDIVDIGADEWNGTEPPQPWGEYPVVHPARWQTVSVQYSCPLVADLIPGDNGANEVAVIAYKQLSGGYWNVDGKAYIWRANGTLAWTSKNRTGLALPIDPNGNNTLSAADIDGLGNTNNAHLEITAPAYGVGGHAVHAYGYDANASTFKPVAGWPAYTPTYEFDRAAAAIGDANLDGSCEVVAGDLSCYVFSWNQEGQWNTTPRWLWEGVAGSDIRNSSVALGDVNQFSDTNRIPDVLVGAIAGASPSMFAFRGDNWNSSDSPDGSAWPKNADSVKIQSSPAIGLIDSDSYNDFAVGADNGKLYIWHSYPTPEQYWTGYQLSSTYPIHSSPVIAELDGQRCVVVGCDNGRVYAIKSDGTPIAGWPSDGISPSWRPGFKIIASPVIADVMNTGSPQIVVACTDGNVYALWADGNNHTGGPVAKMWVCAQPGSNGVEIDSTPTVCSLDGTQVSMIIGSTDGIYKADLYSLQQGESFVPNNTRWPWPTFHRDNARTGCQTTDTNPASPVSASIAGKITLNGNPVQGAKVYIRMLPELTLPAVYGRSATRTDPVLSAGDAASSTDEFDEGQYCLSQLPPNQTYRITVTDANGGHSTTAPDVAVTTGKTILDILLTP